MTSPTIRQIAPATSDDLVNRRVLAMAIDMGLVVVLLLLLRRILGSGPVPFAAVGLLATAVYGVVQGETGRCPGKAVMGLKLVNEQGTPPGTPAALIRLAAWAVDGLPCLGLLGFVLIWLTPAHQRVGDAITRTHVVVAGRTADGATAVADVPRPHRSGPAVVPARADGGDGGDGDEGAVPDEATGSADLHADGTATGTAAAGDDAVDRPAAGGDGSGDEPRAATAARTGYDPIWDPKVGAYVQWDPVDRRWMRYDQTSDSWAPVEAA